MTFTTLPIQLYLISIPIHVVSDHVDSVSILTHNFGYNVFLQFHPGCSSGQHNRKSVSRTWNYSEYYIWVNVLALWAYRWFLSQRTFWYFYFMADFGYDILKNALKVLAFSKIFWNMHEILILHLRVIWLFCS